jgi:hypothetical protein
MTRRAKRPYDRKAWPWVARQEYEIIDRLAKIIQADLLTIQREVLNGSRDYYLLPDLMPVIRNNLKLIQVQCQSFEAKKRRGFPYWAGWSIAEIDFIAGQIRLAVREAHLAYTSRPRDTFLVEDKVQEALEMIPDILAELQHGPGPETDAPDVVTEALDIANRKWRQEDE